ncbi:MAG: hypothetical protein HQ518_25785 [Rhodopirellula sp.]|nr:hypothetical protein [Rhodopirellula sp.]
MGMTGASNGTHAVAEDVQFGLHVVLFQPDFNQHAAHGRRTLVRRVNHEGRRLPGVQGEEQPSFRGMRTQPAVRLAECYPA